MSRRIMYIGGSPCSGKSTVADMLSKERGAYYFKVDDFLDELLSEAAENGNAVCAAVRNMSAEEIWMRQPEIQSDEEFAIYSEIAPFVFRRLEEIDAELIITEGAAFTPEVMKEHGKEDYITIVPSPEFQVEHYRKREWIPYVLKGCSDKEKAFDNWMKRDIIFAEKVRSECEEQGIPCIVNNGFATIEQLYCQVRDMLGI